MQANSQERQRMARMIDELFQAPDEVFAVHYASQRLRRDQTDISPPVAAIAVRNVGTGHGRVFSIRAEADVAEIDLSSAVSPETLARLEYGLLFNYNEFLAAHPAARFVHWYMRDEKFGFAALEHRYRRVLAGINQALHGERSVASAAPFGFAAGPTPYPVRVQEERKVDLARIIARLYGIDRIGLSDLAARSGLSRSELIEGRAEPEVFESGNHARLQWSTSAKARLIADVIERIHDGNLRLQSSPHGGGARGEGRLFINYRREDTEAAAGRLHDRLSADFGASNVFIDTDDIPAGVDYVVYLAQQIEACDVFLAVIGRRWAELTDADGRPRLADERDIVRREIRAALARGIPVIPVLVDGARLPREDQLPVDLHPLRQRNYVEVRNSQFATDAARLASKVREAMEHVRGQARDRG